MKIDLALVRRVGEIAGAFMRGWTRAQRKKGRVQAAVKYRAFGVQSKGRRRYTWDDDEVFETEDEMPGFQLHLPNDNAWYIVRVTPVEGFEAQFSSGRTVSEPVVAWLTQVRAVGAQGTSGTPAQSRVVPGILRDGELVNAAEQEGFERVEQI